MSENSATYDSRQDTLNHIEEVRRLLGVISMDLTVRGFVHDQSKLEDPEKSLFDQYTPKLAGMTYGSEDYAECLKQLQPALQHHYAANSHHPEHFDDGVAGMTLMDLVEMFADWWAATKRHNDGCIRRSIQINRKRFNLDEQIVKIFENTVTYIEQINARNAESAIVDTIVRKCAVATDMCSGHMALYVDGVRRDQDSNLYAADVTSVSGCPLVYLETIGIELPYDEEFPLWARTYPGIAAAMASQWGA